jgi:hypothetical protein
MTIDWMLVGQIAGPVALLFIGALINRLFERRVRLISYYIHTSACRVTPTPPAAPINLHTHAVALKNDGGLAATNVRLHHYYLPDFTVTPSVPHIVETLPDGTRDIVIPQLLPREQVSVTYVYLPPLVYTQINAGIRCDQGYARGINVLMQRQLPQPVQGFVAVLMLLGAVTLLYLLWVIGTAVWSLVLAQQAIP